MSFRNTKTPRMAEIEGKALLSALWLYCQVNGTVQK